MDLTNLLSPEVKAVIRIFAIVIATVHILIALVLFNFIRNVSRQVKAPSEGAFKVMGIVQITLLVGILLAIIFLF